MLNLKHKARDGLAEHMAQKSQIERLANSRLWPSRDVVAGALKSKQEQNTFSQAQQTNVKPS